MEMRREDEAAKNGAENKERAERRTSFTADQEK